MSTARLGGGRNRTVDPIDWADLPRASEHAKLRWLQRGGTFDLSVTEAWVESYPVGTVTQGGSARLHPPTRTLLTVVDGVITTVLDATHRAYTADHLRRCEYCRLEFQPRQELRDCPWCEHEAQQVEE